MRRIIDWPRRFFRCRFQSGERERWGVREYAEAELISEVTLLHPMIRIIIIPHPNSAERERMRCRWRMISGGRSVHLPIWRRVRVPLCARMQ